MAASVITPTVTAHHGGVGKWQVVIGTLAIAAGDYTTGGLTVSFATISEIKSGSVPVTFTVEGIAGYIYRYVPGATKDVGLLMIFQDAGAAAPMAQLAAAATPAAVVADTIRFNSLFPQFR
jgi:hypothetical protein